MGNFRVQAGRSLLVALVAALAIVHGACGGETDSDEATEATTATLAVCRPPNTPSTVPIPAGTALPPGAVATSTATEGPTTTVRGVVSIEPVAARDWYQSAEHLQVLEIEDEGFEMEARVTDGRYRTVVKIERVCPGISEFVAVVAAEL